MSEPISIKGPSWGPTLPNDDATLYLDGVLAASVARLLGGAYRVTHYSAGDDEIVMGRTVTCSYDAARLYALTWSEATDWTAADEDEEDAPAPRWHRWARMATIGVVSFTIASLAWAQITLWWTEAEHLRERTEMIREERARVERQQPPAVILPGARQ